jgi:hypothetical protein
LMQKDKAPAGKGQGFTPTWGGQDGYATYSGVEGGEMSRRVG